MAEKTYIYVGAEAGGLYRKEAGINQRQALTDGMSPSPQTRAIAIHPQHPEVVFVGTQRGSIAARMAATAGTSIASPNRRARRSAGRVPQGRELPPPALSW